MKIRSLWLVAFSVTMVLGSGAAGSRFAMAATQSPPAPSAPAPAVTPAAPTAAATTTTTATTLAPPAPGAAATTTTTTTKTTAPPAPASGSALPDGGGVQARSPGMELPPEAGLPAGPAGAAAPIAAKSPEEIKAEIRDDAFNAALTGLMPLNPPEIRKLLKRFDETKEATEIPVFPYPEPITVVKNVSLDPGVKPIELKLATGNVTTVGMVDATGAPWPIFDMTWAGNFTVTPPTQGSNSFVITPMSEFAAGNVSIRMIGLPTAITFVLRTHRDEVYYRVDARLPENGPFAKPQLIEQGMTLEAGCNCLTSILDGTIPEDAKKLEVSGTDGRTTAYKYNSRTYIRTPLTLLSPAWSESTKSADGMNVYSTGSAPVILLSDQGRMVRARLSDAKDEKDQVK
jgi:intracellular multiplication protein IcmK